MVPRSAKRNQIRWLSSKTLQTQPPPRAGPGARGNYSRERQRKKPRTPQSACAYFDFARRLLGAENSPSSTEFVYPDCSGRRAVTMTERGRQDSVVSAALAHADAIRRTLVKRERGRASATCGSKPRRGGSQHPNKREGPPLILDGPIYSTEYWRTWRTRSRAGMHRGGKCDDSPSVSDPTLYWPVYRSSKGKNVSVRCASGFLFFVNNNNSRAA